MNRRQFFKTSALTAALIAAPRAAFANTNPFRPSPADGWRIFEITTQVDLPAGNGAARVWLPLPAVEAADWMRPMGNRWQGNATTMQQMREPNYGAAMLTAYWDHGDAAPHLELVSRFSARDRAIDLGHGGDMPALDRAARDLFTRPTRLLPTDGIVRDTAAKITRGAKSDLEQARALYAWIVDNCRRDGGTRGCGLGDIRAMLETGNLAGKCADINALYVGLARSVGLPARDVYGIRVADSRFGYHSLGKSGDISKAQHCRAEVWLAGFGWVPVDPADVRKVVLEERPGLTLHDDIVVDARQTLFGAWETNWLAYNFAHDVRLPGSAGAEVPFLMYPQAENATGRRDSLDPAGFAYRITARELAA